MRWKVHDNNDEKLEETFISVLKMSEGNETLTND